ncbi:hypothetical protein K5M33_11520 [Chromobacterium vaccinii]|nr:hypothetical protein [Chromobacterium vaccinii]MBX9357354.1 hypothetical protein [Chromobacterium vaccinii]
MAFFMHDQSVQNITLDEASIRQINTIFQRRRESLRAELAEQNIYLTYIIRFDNKGYKIFSIDELIQYFNQAKSIDRIVFTIESDLSISTARRTGTYFELFLNSNNTINSGLIAFSDNHKEWAENSFNETYNILDKFKNSNYFAHHPLSKLAARLISLFILFLLSILITIKIPLNPKLENGKPFAFLLIFLAFSNIYTYLIQLSSWFLTQQFPSIKFSNTTSRATHWFIQAIILAVLGWIGTESYKLFIDYKDIVFS